MPDMLLSPGAPFADFATALAAANTTLDGTVIYTTAALAGGDTVVFVDSNSDGTADQAVILVGGGTVNAASFL